MKKFALAALAVLGLGACQPAPPPPPPPPAAIDITGTIMAMGGNCHSIRGDNGTMYAVHAGVLVPPARPGARVRVIGVVHPAQDCPGLVLIRADGGAQVFAAMRVRRTRTTTVPK